MSCRLKCNLHYFIFRLSEFQNLIFLKWIPSVEGFYNNVSFLFFNFLIYIFSLFYYCIFYIFNFNVGNKLFSVFAYLFHKNFKTANQFIVSGPIILEIKIGLECFSSFQNEFIPILFCCWYHLMKKVVVLGIITFGYRYLKLACSEIVNLLEIFRIEIE